MRNTLFTATFATALILLFTLSVGASAETIYLIVETCNVYYENNDLDPSYVVDVHYVDHFDESGTSTFTDIPSVYTDSVGSYEAMNLRFPCSPLTDSYVYEFQQGYIYTFNFTFETKTQTPDSFIFSLLASDYEATDCVPIAGCTYTYEKITSLKWRFYITSVLYVDENFNPNVMFDGREFICLEVDSGYDGQFFLTGDLLLSFENVHYTKAIGEDAYYQASVDAIENLPQTEYDFIYNNMPDADGYVTTVKGDQDTVLNSLTGYSEIKDMMLGVTNLEARPCVYFPRVYIPFVDILLWEEHIFYIDTYLENMNPAIMDKIEIALVFIRIVASFSLIYVVVYKMSRVDWWLF